MINVITRITIKAKRATPMPIIIMTMTVISISNYDDDDDDISQISNNKNSPKDDHNTITKQKITSQQHS